MSVERESLLPRTKARFAYWLLALVALAAVLSIVYLFIGTLVTGLFLYYAVRPANRRIRRHVDGDGWAAATTMLLFVVPLLLLVGYVTFLAAQQVDALLRGGVGDLVAPYVNLDQIQSLSELAEDPRALLDSLRQSGLQGVINAALGAVGIIANAVVHVFLMIAVVFYLLRDDRRLARWYRSAVGEESPADRLARNIDRDVANVYFSNIMFMSVIAVLSAVGYSAFNLLAPSSLQIPLPIVLGVLTGVVSIVPLVVGKLVYVPIAAYLFGAALQEPSGLLVYPIAFTVCAFLFLDFIPLTFLLPVMAGRTLHTGLMIFAYVGGTLLFGWYGLFLGPLALVVVLRVAVDVVPDLVRGAPVTAVDEDTERPPESADDADRASGDVPEDRPPEGTRGDGGRADRDGTDTD